MNIQRKAQDSVISIPVNSRGTLFQVKISDGADFLNLKIPATSAQNADFVADYPLPFPTKNTVIEADEAFFEHVGWKKQFESPFFDASTLPGHPAFHFSARCGWLNDPNGLFYLNGKWHLFFQYNPFSCQWGNMHWGHAVSDDLLHWHELGIALYPDHEGMMFSGSAVLDVDNCAGFGNGAILLFYTNSRPDGSGTQNIAYSTDGGTSFLKYDKNPIIPCISSYCDRDPFVVYDPDEQLWRMALYLGDEKKCEFLLLKSHDLLNWTPCERYTIPGGRECPALVRLQDQKSGEWKWVFAEANGFYCIGTIHQDKIVMESAATRFLSGDGYAMQFFHNAPHQSLFIAWMRSGSYAKDTFCGTMSIPMQLSLYDRKIRVAPYDKTEHLVAWEVLDCRRLHSPQGELIFDLTRHIIRFGERSWEIPRELSVLRGTILLDRTSLEYFDETGLFTFILSLPEGAWLSFEDELLR